MKRLLLVLVLTMSFQAMAQQKEFRLNAYGMYVFDDDVDSYYDPTSYYNGTIKGGFEYGGGIEMMLPNHVGMELSYLRLDTEAPMTYYNFGIQNAVLDLGLNFIMAGGTKYFAKPGSKLEGFFGGMAGMSIVDVTNPRTGNGGSSTFFAWGAKAGMNIWASKKVGIKLQAQLLSIVQSVGGGFYFGTGGAGAGISSYSTMYQFGLGGGLVFSLGGGN